MLGNDRYRLEGISTLYGSELKALSLLYRELIGFEAVGLFLNLIYQDKEDFKELIILLNSLNISLDFFEENIQKLEEVSLIRTYKRADDYLFELQKPLAYQEFLEHDILGRLLIKKVSKEYYAFLRNGQFKNKIAKTGFKEVSHKLDFQRLSDWSKELEVKYSELKDVQNKDSEFSCLFDIKGFMKTIKNTSFPSSLRTYENLENIGKAADTYAIKKDEFRKFVIRSTSIDPIAFDLNKLLAFCRNASIDLHNDKEGYDMPCSAFLLNISKGKEPSLKDKQLIERLRMEYRLPTPVVNYLLEYALKKCDNQLFPNYLYTIASNFKRNDVDTIAKAKEFLDRSQKSYNNTKSKVVDIPDYEIKSDEDLNISDEEYLAFLSKYENRGN